MKLQELLIERASPQGLLKTDEIEKIFSSKKNGLILVYDTKVGTVVAGFFTRGNSLELHAYDRDIKHVFGAKVWDAMAGEFTNSKDNPMTKDGRVISGTKEEIVKVLSVMQNAIGLKLELDPES